MESAAKIRSLISTNNCRIADFGCGYPAQTSLDLSTDAEIVVCVDSNQQVVNELQNLCTSNNESQIIPITTSNFWTSDLNEFDIVLCSLVLHHVTDLPATLKNIHSKLRLSGTIIVIDYEFELKNIANELRLAGFEIKVAKLWHKVKTHKRRTRLFILLANKIKN